MKMDNLKSNLSVVDFLIFLIAVLLAVIILMVTGCIHTDYASGIRQFAFSVGVIAACYCIGCLLYGPRR